MSCVFALLDYLVFVQHIFAFPVPYLLLLLLLLVFCITFINSVILPMGSPYDFIAYKISFLLLEITSRLLIIDLEAVLINRLTPNDPYMGREG